MTRLVIIGSNSIHCKRFIQGILDNSDYELSIITNLPMPEFTDIPQHQINFALTNLKAKSQIARILMQINPQVIHIHQANSYAWHSLRAIRQLSYRPQVILTAWGSDVLLLPRENKIFERIVKFSLQNADVITSDSLYMSGVIKSLLGKVSKPIHTINFGIQDLPGKQNLTTKKDIILSSRLHKPLYRIDKIITAFANLIHANLIAESYTLVVSAGGEESDNLQKLAGRLQVSDRVKFTGMLPYKDLAEYYQQAKVFVSVPESDGTASSLLEAMAYGCIPVLSNLPANLEWIIHECNGYITVNIDELQEEILRALRQADNNEEYGRLYDFNYNLIQSKATLKNNMRKFLQLYHL